MSRVVEIDIHGRRLRVRTDDEEGYVRELERFLRLKMADIKRASNAPDVTSVALLTLLDVADSLMRERERSEALASGIRDRVERVMGVLERLSESDPHLAHQLVATFDEPELGVPVREAEREKIFNEYADRKSELVTGVVRRFERGNLVVDLGRAEAVLPLREQCPRESYRVNDRIQAYVLDVNKQASGSQIVLSRTSPGLLIKLFEMEVPEIYEGIVKIEAAAREPGARSKVAVSSSDRDVDPVGACVGMKGSRVQAVVQELRGEQVDIVPFDEDPARFVCNALAPAEVSRVLIDGANHAMEIIVPDDQLLLAIGRRGQNLRLASQLTGWKLDIVSESKVKDRALKSLGRLKGVNDIHMQTLYNYGIRCADDLLRAEAAFLANIPGIGAEMVERLKTDSVRVVAEEGMETQALKKEEEARRQASHAAQAARHRGAEAAVRGVDRSEEVILRLCRSELARIENSKAPSGLRDEWVSISEAIRSRAARLALR